jgi:hypothetical protein
VQGKGGQGDDQNRECARESGQEKVGRETVKIGKMHRKTWIGKRWQGWVRSLFKGNVNPQHHRGPIRGSNKRYCCERVLGFLQERWAGKISRWARSLFKGNVNPNSIGV